MNKIIGSIVLLTLLFSFCGPALANSGPVYWDGHPSSDIMAIDKNSPIKIASEDLVFDFSNNDDTDAAIGRVTATYEMVNPTNELQSVEMVFPFVGNINSFSPNDTVITSESEILSYDLYLGDQINQENKKKNFEFEKIVSTITNQPYKPRNFKENEKGKLYTFDVTPTTDQAINFVVDFQFDSERTKILTNGFNRYERNDTNTRIAAWTNETQRLEIFILGEDIDFQINAFTDGELIQETKLLTYETATYDVGIQDYLLEFIKNNEYTSYVDTISDIQLYNIYAKYLDGSFANEGGYSSMYDLLEAGNRDRVLSLVYTVLFPPNSSQEVAVTYNTFGTMDRTETATPLYTFDYIVNPANNWSDFENLTVTIFTPEQAPYIISSSIVLDNQKNNVYTANLQHLPKDDLSFTLFSNKEVTLVDKVKGNYKNNFIFYAVLAFSLLVIFSIVIIIYLIKKRFF